MGKWIERDCIPHWLRTFALGRTSLHSRNGRRDVHVRKNQVTWYFLICCMLLVYSHNDNSRVSCMRLRTFLLEKETNLRKHECMHTFARNRCCFPNNWYNNFYQRIFIQSSRIKNSSKTCRGLIKISLLSINIKGAHLHLSFHSMRFVYPDQKGLSEKNKIVFVHSRDKTVANPRENARAE